jgi:uncharacterized membrane protein
VVRARAVPPAGLSVSGPGTVRVAAGGTAQVRVKVTAGAHTAPGTYTVPITVTSPGRRRGVPAASVTTVLTVSVPAPHRVAGPTRG